MARRRCVRSFDIAVIGGGVIGLALAYEMKLRREKLRIAVIDKGEAGREASWASAGLLEPQLLMRPAQDKKQQKRQRDFFNLCVESQIIFEEYIRRVEWVSKISCEYRKEGILHIMASKESPEKMENWFAGLGLRAQYWNEDEASIHEPGLAEGLSAIHLPDNHQVESRQLVLALVEACKKLQVTLLEYHAVEDFEIRNEAIALAKCKSGDVSCAHYVLCAGAWSSQFPSLMEALPPVKPVRGQMLAMQMPNNSFIRHAGYWNDFYYVPRNDGRLLAGSTAEEAGFDKTVSDQVTAGFIQRLQEIIPNSEYFTKLDSWTGLRPASPDNFPLLGETRLSNLSIASGHFRNGILLAPITAKLMADFILDKTVSPLMESFQVSRFG
jgi:glycine oxidase